MTKEQIRKDHIEAIVFSPDLYSFSNGDRRQRLLSFEDMNDLQSKVNDLYCSDAASSPSKLASSELDYYDHGDAPSPLFSQFDEDNHQQSKDDYHCQSPMFFDEELFSSYEDDASSSCKNKLSAITLPSSSTPPVKDFNNNKKMNAKRKGWRERVRFIPTLRPVREKVSLRRQRSSE